MGRTACTTLRSSAVLAAALLVWAAAPAARAGGDVLGLPAYPLISTPIPADMETNGVPQQTLIAFTDDPIRTVLRFYREALSPRGVRIVEHAYSLQSAYIGYHDEAAALTHLVSAVAQPDGRTLLLFSSLDPRPLVGRDTEVPPDLPGLPGAVQVVTTDGTYGGTRHRTVHYIVPGMTPEGARRALAAAARAGGWEAQSDAEVLPGQDLSLRRGAATCMIQVRPAVAPEGGGPAASVGLIVLETGITPPAEDQEP